MKKGATVNIIAGAMEIFLGIYLLVVTVLMAVLGMEIPIGYGLITPISVLLSIFSESGLSLVFIAVYLTLAVIGILSLILILYGSLTITFMRKEAGEFYKKKKSMSFFLISSFIYTLYFLFGFFYSVSSELFDIFSLVLSVFSIAIFVLRFIGLIQYRHGMSDAPKATESEKVVPQLGEYNENADLVTKLKRLNAMRDMGQISEKEYNEIKKKLIGEN